MLILQQKLFKKKNDEELKKRFKNKLKFSNDNINRFNLLLRKGVYLYEYMHEWEKLMKHHCLKKKNFVAA